MNVFSNFSKNSKESLSSWLSASSPTTAFMAAASLPMAYFAYLDDQYQNEVFSFPYVPQVEELKKKKGTS